MKSLTITICDPIQYYKERVSRYGYKELFSLSDTGYPRFLATGLADYARNDVLVMKYPACLAKYYRRLIYHEFGHLAGLDHIKDRSGVMYPNFLRGDRGIEDIRDYFIKGFDLDIEEFLK